MQEQNQRLYQHNVKLRNRVADLQVKSKSKGRSSKLADSSSTRSRRSNNDQTVKLGKKYAIMVFPWANTSHISEGPTNGVPEPENPTRFRSLDAFYEGLTNELFAFLKDPALYRLFAENSVFKRDFFKQVKQGRTTALHTVRECATIIFDGIDAIPASIWHPKTSSDARSESPALHAMLQFPGTSAVNAPFSPIFYPNRVRDNQKLFMNMYQVKVLFCFYSVTYLNALFRHLPLT
ncbi:hypothetical protein EV361DRAFT_811086 [Lentinula raphanica]|nr:hypothetical protein EV361DRAFT_811086 [Lentinula raphanica]